MYKKEQHMLTIGKENANGFVYTEEMAESILSADVSKVLGTVGSMSQFEASGYSIPLLNVSHTVKKIYRDGNELKCDIDVLIDTMYGRKLKLLMDDDLVVFKPEGSGEIIDGEIRNYKLFHINAILKSETT